jgi:hypothetical protein
MELEGMRSSDNSSMAENFVRLENEGKLPFGKERYKARLGALTFDDPKDFHKFVDLLNDGFTDSWIPGSSMRSEDSGVQTFDEDIFKNQPSSELKKD